MTEEDLVKRLNLERATLCSRIQELERIHTKWSSLLRCLGIDMTLGPERAGTRVSYILSAAKRAPQLLDLLQAYESQMCYRVYPCDRDNYESPEAEVHDFSLPEPVVVCGCDNLADAAMVAAALNANQKKTT